jgi:hypothetical protein
MTISRADAPQDVLKRDHPPYPKREKLTHRIALSGARATGRDL